MTMTLTEIHDTVTELDPDLDPTDPTYHVAALLLASATVGTDPFTLAAFTGEHIEWVMQIAVRLRASGVWEDDGVACNWWDEESGGLEFWLDVLVAQGLMERVPG